MILTLLRVLLLGFLFYLPGYLVNQLYYKYDGLEGVLTSIFVSISLVIIMGLILSLLNIFNFWSLIIIFSLINGGLIIKWKFL